MIIQTEIDVAHLELIKIFIKANELVGVVIKETPFEIRGRFHMGLQLESIYEPTSETFTFMGFRHCGILNMFDDYLLKCGIPCDAIKPKSYHRQLQEEKEAGSNASFMKMLETKMKTIGKINNEYSNT